MEMKPSKTLGSRDTPCVLAFESALSGVDKPIAARWAIATARDVLLPVFQRHAPQDTRLDITLDAALDWLDGKVKLPYVKNLILNAAHQAAREMEHLPAAQAAARACAQAASAIHVKSHALGIIFYGAAALAYEQMGTGAEKSEYDSFLDKHCQKMTASLQEYAAQARKGEP